MPRTTAYQAHQASCWPAAAAGLLLASLPPGAHSYEEAQITQPRSIYHSMYHDCTEGHTVNWGDYYHVKGKHCHQLRRRYDCDVKR